MNRNTGRLHAELDGLNGQGTSLEAALAGTGQLRQLATKDADAKLTGLEVRCVEPSGAWRDSGLRS